MCAPRRVCALHAAAVSKDDIHSFSGGYRARALQIRCRGHWPPPPETCIIYIYVFIILDVSSEKVKEPFNLSFLRVIQYARVTYIIYLRYDHLQQLYCYSAAYYYYYYYCKISRLPTSVCIHAYYIGCSQLARDVVSIAIFRCTISPQMCVATTVSDKSLYGWLDPARSCIDQRGDCRR